MKLWVVSLAIKCLLLASAVAVVSGSIKCHDCNWTSNGKFEKDCLNLPSNNSYLRSYSSKSCFKLTAKLDGVDYLERRDGISEGHESRLGKCSDTWLENSNFKGIRFDNGTLKICYCGSDGCNNSPGLNNDPITDSRTEPTSNLARALASAVPLALAPVLTLLVSFLGITPL